MNQASGIDAAGLRFGVLGPLEVIRSGAPLPLGGRQQRAVLALLLVEPDAVVSLAQLADAVWGEHTPAGAVGTIQTYISHLREVLEPDRVRGEPATVLVTEPGGYRLHLDGAGLDAATFERRVRSGRAALEAGRNAEAATELDEAVGLWRGPVLADLTDFGFVRTAADRLDELRLDALEARADAQLALGRHRQLLTDLDQLIRTHPLRERFRAQQMLALYRCGRQSEALTSYQQLCTNLAEELGIDPSPPLQQLHQAILRQDPELDWQPAAELFETVDAALRLTWSDKGAPPPLVTASGAIDSPYRGLNAFDERDAAFFFGREAAATALLERMSQKLDGSGLLVVSGVSGAGKSSLLQAGILARLRREGLAAAPESAAWPYLVFTPGRAPLDELAVRVALLARVDAAVVRRQLEAQPGRFALTARQAALTQGAFPATDAEPSGSRLQHRLLLVVDQFEQLFTQCPDEDQRRAFVTALHAAATSTRTQTPAALVVLSVRADFEARCADYPQLADAIQDRYLVMSMTDRQLRMAITEPAKQAGSRVEDDLVDALVREIGTRGPVSSSAFPASGPISGAGVLPLLSHALDQAWRNRAGDALALPDYERAGGIEGAVAESAQHAYDRLTPAQQSAARQVFIRLTATTADGVDTANRVARTELIEGKRASDVQDVEAVLEAFAAERLLTLAAGTVEISHEALLTAWPLLRDTWLTETHADRVVRTRLHNVAAEWRRASHDPSYLYRGSLLETAGQTATRIGADPNRYPPLSDNERDFLQASRQAHSRRVRTLTAFLLVLVLGVGAVAVWAFRASQNATQQRDVRVSRQLINQSETVGTDNTIARLESIAAWRIHPSNDARYAMLAAATRPGIATLTGHTGPVESVAFSPDGKALASGGDDQTVRLWDVAAHHQIGTPLTGHTNGVTSVAFSPDGKTLASGGDDQTVRLWDVAAHRETGTPLTGHTNSVSSVAFSPDGKTLASGSVDGTVRLWDVAAHRQIGTLLTGHTGEIYSVAFSPDGNTLASGSWDHTVRLWDVATHRQIGTPLTGHTRPVESVAFSRDGKTLASGSDDGTVRLWDVATHRQIGAPLTGPTGEIYSVTLSPDGETLASGSVDGAVRLWDLSTHRQISTPLTGHTNGVTSVAFSPDGNTLASGSWDDTVRLWDVATHRQIGIPLTGHTGPVESAAFSPDGKTLASGGDDHTVRLWDVVTHHQIGAPLTGHTRPVESVAFSPDGKTLASGSDDGTVRLWDVATRRQVGAPLTGAGATGEIYSVAFTADGRTLASGGFDGTVRLWDLATHLQIGTPLTGHIGPVESVVFGPDGKTLASGGFDGTVRLWDLATHLQIGTPLTGLTGEVGSVVFGPDGKTLASGGFDGTVRLWDLATHRQIGTPLTGHTNGVTSVAFGPDGKTLASGGFDGTVRLWDVATHRQIGIPLTGHTRPVTSVAFSPDGKTLASGSDDATIRLWGVNYLVDVVRHLCESTARSLTTAEWRKYVPPGPHFRSLCP